MSERFVSAVALYGPKSDPVRSLLADLQTRIAERVDDHFRPYSLTQIHATLIAFNGVTTPETGTIVNQYYLESTGAALEMDFHLAMRVLDRHFSRPMAVRFGGYQPDDDVPFLSRGRHLFERAFSVLGNAFVLIGWPAGTGQPLNRLRRDMNAANVLHRYHQPDGDVDDDFYMVLGHHDGAAGDALERIVAEVRDTLAAHPVDLDVGIHDIKIVAADSHTLAPPVFVGDIPVDACTMLGLMR